MTARDKDNKTLAPTIKTIQVNPDISYIRSKVAETFPTANLKIIAGGPPGSLIVTGTVESVEDIDPIRTFLNGIASQYSGSRWRAAASRTISSPMRCESPDHRSSSSTSAWLRLIAKRFARLGVDFFQRSGTNFLGTSIGGAGSTIDYH